MSSRNQVMTMKQQEPGGGQRAAGTGRWLRSSRNEEVAKEQQEQGGSQGAGTKRWLWSSRNQEVAKRQQEPRSGQEAARIGRNQRAAEY